MPNTPAKIGRPSKYTDELAEEICSLLAEGKSLLRICKREDMPSRKTVETWLLAEEHKDFLRKYMSARVLQADHLVDETLEIADDGSNDSYEDDEGNTVTKYDVIKRSQLRVSARQWYAAKVAPRKYGERQLIESLSLDDPTGDVEVE